MEEMTDDSMIKASDDPQPTRAVRVMFAGSQCFGLFAEEIESIADWRTPSPLPDAPTGVLGVVSIRGRMLTVLDPAVLLGESAGAARGKIVRLRGDEQIALAVDRTGEVIELAADELKAASEASKKGPLTQLLLGVVSKGEQSIAVLDHNQLFATAMRGRERRQRQF